MLTWAEFEAVDIRVGTVLKAETFTQARNPAIKLEIDFGPELGIKKSSAQITQLYEAEGLIGSQILAVVNFPPKQIANMISEVLVLGILDKDGVILLRPDKPAENGRKIS
jgi:tRNA-binding protein